MDRSRFIAGLIGPTLALVAVSLFINRGLAAEMGAELAGSYLLILIAGAGTLAAGLAIVMSHKVWRGWPIIVTVFGWLAIVSGVVRVLFPRQLAELAPGVVASQNGVDFVAGLILVLGLFLSWKAFRA
jgi:hypothetical protein